MQKSPYVFPIIGGRKIEHLISNLEALGITLEPEHFAYIESILPYKRGFPYDLFVRIFLIRPISLTFDAVGIAVEQRRRRFQLHFQVCCCSCTRRVGSQARELVTILEQVEIRGLRVGAQPLLLLLKLRLNVARCKIQIFCNLNPSW